MRGNQLPSLLCPRAMGSVSANRTRVASSAQRAKMASSVWRTQITLAAKVSSLLTCQVKEGDTRDGPGASVCIPQLIGGLGEKEQTSHLFLFGIL